MADTRFYANPEEQRSWLAEVLLQPGVWGVLHPVWDGDDEVASAELITALDFTGDPLRWQCIMGHAQLGAYVTEIGRMRSVPDLIRSRAVVFEPARVHEQNVLEGRLAMMSERDFEAASLDYVAVRDFYRTLAKNLAHRFSRAMGLVVSCSPGLPPSPVRDGTLVSNGAMALHSKGHKLRQFPTSTVELDVV